MKQCLCEKCWKGYVKRGMKTLFGKKYPNCVKKSKAGKRRESVNEADLKSQMKAEMDKVKKHREAMRKHSGKDKDKADRALARMKAAQARVDKLQDKIIGIKRESVNEESKTIKSIQNLADKNKYGTVSGTRMNGKTAKEIIAIYNHPKMKSFKSKMDKLKSHELMDLTIRLPKILGIKVESVNENMRDVMKNVIHQVKTFDKPSNAKLMTIKVINKLKEKRNSSKSTSNKKQLQKMINKVESDYKKGKYLKESVNEGKGVEKILKMADEKSFGKIAGKTVDGMTAGLFKAVYDKAPQNSKDKIDKMSEKQLYVFMGKLWNKFGRQVKLS